MAAPGGVGVRRRDPPAVTAAAGRGQRPRRAVDLAAQSIDPDPPVDDADDAVDVGDTDPADADDDEAEQSSGWTSRPFGETKRPLLGTERERHGYRPDSVA